jgi:ABC-type sugar transport system ATPase subunit
MLIDEPSIGPSPIVVEELFGLIRDLRARGTTILLIAQSAKRALENSDHGIVLELGRTRGIAPRRSSPMRASASCFWAAGFCLPLVKHHHLRRKGEVK